MEEMCASGCARAASLLLVGIKEGVSQQLLKMCLASPQTAT